jgi:hypothetical protein
MEDLAFEMFVGEYMEGGASPLRAVGEVLDVLSPEELEDVAETYARTGDVVELKELVVQLVRQNREVVRFCRSH